MLGDLFAFWGIAIRESAAALWRRLTGRRLRPTWTLTVEVLTRCLKADAKRLRTKPLAARRRWQDFLAGAPRLRALKRRDQTIANVPCVRLTQPSPRAGAPLLVYFHGGSMQAGSFRTHAELIVRLALASGLEVVVPEYRLAPEHPYPAGHDDCFRVVEALQGEGRPLVLAGDSSGGLLAVATCLRLREKGLSMPARLGLVCPWSELRDEPPSRRAHEPFDWAEVADFVEWSETYRHGADASSPELSIVRAELTGLPPMLVQYGTAEMLFDEVQAFCQRARSCGVAVDERPYEDMVHNWHLLAPYGVEPARDAIAEMGRFLGG